MVLAGQHHSLEPGVRQRLYNFVRIEIGRIEQLRLLVAITPFLPGKGIDGEMDEGIHLHVVPCQLSRRRNRLQRGNSILHFRFRQPGGQHAGSQKGRG